MEMPTVASLPPNTEPVLSLNPGFAGKMRFTCVGLLSVSFIEEFKLSFILSHSSLTKSWLWTWNSQISPHPPPPLKVAEAKDNEGNTHVTVTTVIMDLESKS